MAPLSLATLDPWIQVANTAGSIVVVVLFLWFLKGERALRDTIETQRLESLRQLNEANQRAHKEVVERVCGSVDCLAVTIHENTKLIGRVERALNGRETRGD